MHYKIAIIGGGASGFFAAIRAAQVQPNADVRVFESSPSFLSKVKISGGGRCNVTHNQFNPSLFSQNYPRGKKELRSPFTVFQAADTVEWFKSNGVKLVAEADGRMFPSTNTSDTVIECFMKSALNLGVSLHPRSKILEIAKHQNENGDPQFLINVKDSKPFVADRVLIATGSSKSGYEFAANLGHTITELAPSLFSFKTRHPVLKDLSGTSFPSAKLALRLPDGKFQQEGPLLITHRGLSGPAILKLSAWAAREMKRAAYKGELFVNWSGAEKPDHVRASYEKLKSENSKSLVKNVYPQFFTKRFWHSLLEFLQISGERKWGELPKKEMNLLVENTYSTPIKIEGQNRFKEEFVECGGVKLSEVNFKTMESKICPGLYFSGEILDVDGITGGFNFQNAWTTGYIAGGCMASV